MASYTVRDPSSGKTVTLKGDSPPTEQELTGIFDQLNSKTDWKGVVGSALKEATGQPGTVSRGMMAPPGAGGDPSMQANALPSMMGTIGGMSPFPGGATIGTGMGQGLRYGMNKFLDKPQPSGWQVAGELGGAALGDIAAIPAMKAKYYGGQIGKAESAFPGMSEVVKEAPPSGPRTAVKFAQQLKGQDLTPLEAKRFQPAMKTIYDKGIPFQKPFKMYSPDFAQANQAVTQGLNKIPGRKEAADAMAQAMKIPNALNNLKQTVWQNPILRRLIYAAITGVGLGGGANLAFKK